MNKTSIYKYVHMYISVGCSTWSRCAVEPRHEILMFFSFASQQAVLKGGRPSQRASILPTHTERQATAAVTETGGR